MTIQKPDPVLDFDRLRATAVESVPFPFLIVPGFVETAWKDGIARDFPEVTKAGSFPLPSLRYGPAFAALIEALTGREMTRIIADKFAIDLDDRPTMTT